MGGYVEFLLSTGRWEGLADDVMASDRGNSHMPVLPTYLRMLDVFEPIWQAKMGRGFGANNFRFDGNELQAVLGAWPYASNGER